MMGGLEPAVLDPSIWYRITASFDVDSADLSSELYFDDLSNLVDPTTTSDHNWQFEPVDDRPGRYTMRLSASGPNKQLSVCHVDDQAYDSRTRPCMASSSSSEEQHWDVTTLRDGSFRFANARNGSDYHLGMQMGSRPFMEKRVANTPELTHHWLLREAGSIDDRAHARSFHKPRTTASMQGRDGSSAPLAPRQDEPASTGLSVGGAAGVGIAVALAIIVTAFLAGFFFLRRRGVTLTQIRQLERQQDNRHSNYAHRRNPSNRSSLPSDRRQLRPQDSFYSASNAEFLGTNISPSATPASTCKTIYSKPSNVSNKELYLSDGSKSLPFLPSSAAVTPPLPTAGNPIMLAEMPTGLESKSSPGSTRAVSTTNAALKQFEANQQTWHSNPWAFLPPASGGTTNNSSQQSSNNNINNNPYHSSLFEAPTYNYRSELDSGPPTPRAIV